MQYIYLPILVKWCNWGYDFCNTIKDMDHYALVFALDFILLARVDVDLDYSFILLIIRIRCAKCLQPSIHINTEINRQTVRHVIVLIQCIWIHDTIEIVGIKWAHHSIIVYLLISLSPNTILSWHFLSCVHHRSHTRFEPEKKLRFFSVKLKQVVRSHIMHEMHWMGHYNLHDRSISFRV